EIEFGGCKYSVNGKPKCESSKSEKVDDAIKLRRKRIKETREGPRLSSSADRVLIDELLRDYLEHSRVKNNKATFYDVTTKVEKFVRPYFGPLRASKLTTEMTKAYRRQRVADGVTGTTVDRHLSCLRKAFNLGHENTPCKVAVVPRD